MVQRNLAVLFFILVLTFIAVPGTIVSAEVPEINLSHLDWLKDELTLPDGSSLPIWWVYSEPDESGNRNSPYHYVEGASEGVSCVDDVARAAITYLKHYEYYGDQHSLEQAKDAFRFIAHMRTPEGHFYNFITANGTINKLGGTSSSGVNWWTARAMRALAWGYRVFSKVDPDYASYLEGLLIHVIDAIERHVTANSLSRYGVYKNLHGTQVPAWFVGDGADASAVVLLGLAEYYEAKPQERIGSLMSKFADGITQYQFGSFDQPPFLAHLPWGGSLFYWHAWGSHQMAALAKAGRLLNNEEWIESAEREANSFLTYMLSGPGLLANMGPVPLTYVQLSYGAEVITSGLLELAKATGKEIYAEMAGIAGAWFMGDNPGGMPMYDEKTGRGWDGIDPPREGETKARVSFNAGAESTIEALFALMDLIHNPTARNYLELSTRWKQDYQVIEAESFSKALKGRPRKSWAQFTSEGMPSGQFFVQARRGDSFALSFRTYRDQECIPYVAFERQTGEETQVAMRFRLLDESAKELLSVQIPMGGSPDTKYLTMQKIADPVYLPAGRYEIRAESNGSSRTLRAALDAIVLQPVIQWRQLAGGGFNVVFMKNFAPEKKTGTAEIDLRFRDSVGPVEVRVRCYDSDGNLTSASQMTVEDTGELVPIELPVEGFGYTIADWR